MKKNAVISLLACYCLYQSVFSHLATMSMSMMHMNMHGVQTIEQALPMAMDHAMAVHKSEDHDNRLTTTPVWCHDDSTPCCDSIASCMWSCLEREKNKVAIEIPSRTRDTAIVVHGTSHVLAQNTIWLPYMMTLPKAIAHAPPPSTHDLMHRIGVTVRII